MRDGSMTVGQLAEMGAEVRWECHGCGAKGRADLARILAAKGPAYDLTDRTAACRQPGCTYWVCFYASAGQRHWPLSTEAGLIRMMPRRSAWLSANAPPYSGSTGQSGDATTSASARRARHEPGSAKSPSVA